MPNLLQSVHSMRHLSQLFPHPQSVSVALLVPGRLALAYPVGLTGVP
jgi:hypothetical protein